MLCPKCKTDMFIHHMKTIVSGDDSPEKQTIIRQAPVYVCRRKECGGFSLEGEPIHIYPPEGTD